jgi:hypothetical protein
MDSMLIHWFFLVVGLRMSVGSSPVWLKVLNFSAALLQGYILLSHYKLI